MTTLDQEHPAVLIDFQTDDGFIKSPIVRECAHCGDVTAWFHRSLSLHLCSRGCYEKYCADRLSRRSRKWEK